MSMDESNIPTRLHLFLRYYCDGCTKLVHVDDAVWLNHITLKPDEGEDGRPYHKECAERVANG